MPTRGRIPALDGMRAAAIIAVMISHGFILGDSTSKYARAITYTAEHLGALGVGLFFAISGYLITTLLLTELESTGHISLSAFYIRRAFRILPPAYLYLAALVLLRRPLQQGELASAAFFFSNYWPERAWFTQHFWSLSMEEHFYLLWPVALRFLSPNKAKKKAMSLIPIIVVWRHWSLSHIHWPVPALQRTDLRLDAFLCAAVLAITLKTERRGALLSCFCTPLFRLGATTVLAVTSLWATIGSAPEFSTFAQASVLPPLMISIVHWKRSWVFITLESTWLRRIGRISYGLYLWQQFFLIGHSVPTFQMALQQFIPNAIAPAIIATVGYTLLERPLLRVGHQLSEQLTRQVRKRPAGTPGRSAQVSWRDEPDAPNSEGSPGVRPKTRRQAG